MTNEAAERLLDWLDKAFQEPPIRPISYRAFRPLVLDSIEGIKAAERRATWDAVNRVLDEHVILDAPAKWDALRRAILDEEAAR